MKALKKILLLLVVLFIAIQFIRPARNKSSEVLPIDISETIQVPGNVLAVLKTSCYDCHSNNTRYPWYVNIQPMGWMMAKHIKKGKEDLNFSEFGSYSKRKQFNKLRAIESSIKDGSMPLSDYLMLHENAMLSKEDRALVTEWVSKTKSGIEENK